MSPNIGYYFGLVSGALVDKVQPASKCFIISGILSLVGFLGLMWPISVEDEDYSIFLQLITIIFMFLAGLGASIAMISSVVILAKNFDTQLSVLLTAVMITYLKTANCMDFDIRSVFEMGVLG
jgi:MFS family permease